MSYLANVAGLMLMSGFAIIILTLLPTGPWLLASAVVLTATWFALGRLNKRRRENESENEE